MNWTSGVFGPMVVVVVGFVTACGDPSASSIRLAGRGETPGPSATSRMVDGCPVTIPRQPGFVPPQPYPSDPSEPPASGGVWYGTPGLWTILDSTGAVWSLPVGKDGHVADKTLWFSEKFSTEESEDFSGNDDITITAVHLEGSAPKTVQKGGGAAFNDYLRNFILVGLEVPEPGCWEVTARYEGAELSYVMLVKDDE